MTVPRSTLFWDTCSTYIRMPTKFSNSNTIPLFSRHHRISYFSTTMPAVRVKPEPVDAHRIPGNDKNSASASSRPEDGHHRRQYVADRSARIRDNALPYRQPEPLRQQQEQQQPVRLIITTQFNHSTFIDHRSSPGPIPPCSFRSGHRAGDT